MATRLYLEFGATPLGTLPGTGGGNWSSASGYTISVASRAPRNTTLTNQTITNAGAGTAEFICTAAFISDPLAAQTISGNISGQIQGSESNANNNATVAISVRVINTAGAYVATLLLPTASDNTAATPPEMATTLTNRSFQDVNEATAIALTSYACAAGDRLYIEIGVREVRNTGTEVLRYGSNASTGDLAVDNTTVLTTRRPWVEFATTLTFQPNVAEAAGSVTVADFVGLAATTVQGVAESLTNVGTALAVAGFIAVSAGTSTADAVGDSSTGTIIDAVASAAGSVAYQTARGLGITATNTGRRFPLAATTLSRTGGEFLWEDPNDALFVGGYANVFLSGAPGTDYLVLKAFDLATVPDGATIAGITVRMTAESFLSGGNLKVQLQDETGALIGSAKSLAMTGTIATERVYGGIADLWGATLSASIVKDADFGIRIWNDDASSFDGFNVDYATIEVEYSTVTIVSGVASAAGIANNGNVEPGRGAYYNTLTLLGNTGLIHPSLGQNVTRTTGHSDWIFAEGIEDKNTNGAVCNFTVATGSNYLKATNFAALQTLLPAAGTVKGIKLHLKSTFADTPEIVYAHLIDGTGAQISIRKQVTVDNTGSVYDFSIGGPTDTWNAFPSLDTIKDVGFGVRVYFETANNAVTIYTLALEVTYSTAVEGAGQAAGGTIDGTPRGVGRAPTPTSTGPIWPYTFENLDRGGGAEWGSGGLGNLHPAFIGSWTYCVTIGSAGSDYLVVKNLDSPGVPAGATVKGVTVQFVGAGEADAAGETFFTQLQDDTGALIGTAKSFSKTGFPSTIDTLGGIADLWGATLTPAIVNSPNFGVRLWVETANAYVGLDSIIVNVEFEVAAPAAVASAVGTSTVSGRGAYHGFSGPSEPRTSTNLLRTTGDIAWTNYKGIRADNLTLATGTAPTKYLIGRYFVFPSLPQHGAIKGIVARIHCRQLIATTNADVTASIQLVRFTSEGFNPSTIGSAKTFTIPGGSSPAGAVTDAVVGGSTDLWGGTAAVLTADLVKSYAFAIRFWVAATSVVEVDSISLEVYYTDEVKAASVGVGVAVARWEGNARTLATEPFTRIGPASFPAAELYGSFSKVAAGEGVATASGTSTADAVSAALVGAIAQSFGTSPVDGISATSLGGAGQSIGTSTAQFVGAAQSSATAAAAGTVTTSNFVGAYRKSADAASVGTSVVDGKSNALKPAVGDNCAGTSTAQFVGARIVASRADAAGTVTVANAVSVSLFGGRAESVGLSTVQAQSFNIAPMQAASAGLSVIDGRSAATKRSDAAAAGTVLTANFVADARFNGRADSVGISTVQATSAATKASRADSAGVSVCGFVSQSINASVGNAAGLSVVDGLSQAGTPGVINSVGTSVVDGRSAANQPRAFDSQGVSVVDGRSAAAKASVAASAGLASPVDAVGRSLFGGAMASTSTSVPLGVSAAVKASVAATAGLSTVQATGKVLGNGQAQSVGTSTATFVGAQRIAAVGNAAGTSTANAGTGSGGQSVGTSTATFVGRSNNASVAASAGVGVATGVSGIGLNAVANSTGTSTATFVGATRVSGVAASAGVGAATGVSAIARSGVGSSSGFCIAEAYSITFIAGHVGHSAGTSTANFVGASEGEVPTSPGTACGGVSVKCLVAAGVECQTTMASTGVTVKYLVAHERVSYNVCN